MAKRLKRATYLTELFVKNARSFKDDHCLSLSDENGSPSRWTLILGENGVGKTTLLQCLAHLAPNKNTDSPSGTLKPVFYLEPIGIAYTAGVERLGRHGDIDFEMHASYLTDCSLAVTPKKQSKRFRLGVTFKRRNGKIENLEPIVSRAKDVAEPLVLSYGASRRMGVGNLDAAADGSEVSSLFDDNKLLVDAEELVQQLDYAALKERGNSSKRHLTVFKTMIAALLPDVGTPDNIIVYGPAPIRKGAATGVHVRVPYGEVPLRELSFGYQTMTAWLSDIAWRLFKRLSWIEIGKCVFMDDRLQQSKSRI
jgi:energy-coupling factor transporter ATP-binding protein EcfA2